MVSSGLLIHTLSACDEGCGVLAHVIVSLVQADGGLFQASLIWGKTRQVQGVIGRASGKDIIVEGQSYTRCLFICLPTTFREVFDVDMEMLKVRLELHETESLCIAGVRSRRMKAQQRESTQFGFG